MRFDISAIVSITRLWFKNKTKYQTRKDKDIELAFYICNQALKEHNERERKDQWFLSNRIGGGVPNQKTKFPEQPYAATSGLLQYAFFAVSVRESETNDSERKSKIIKDIVSASPNIIEIKNTPEIQEWCETNIPNKWKHIKNTDFIVFDDTETAALFKIFCM